MQASPSALKNFACPRRWAFSRFGGFPREDKPWFKFGRIVDAMGERYLKTGERPLGKTPEGRLFLRMLPLLAQPGRAQTQVELRFRFDGHTIKGYADSVHVEDHPIPVVLGDLKTFGNRNYILDETTIHEDPQVVGYSGALHQLLDQPAIRARWTYGDKKSERAHPVDAVIHADQNLQIARKRFLPLLDSMDRICQDPPRSVAEINLIPNDPTQCGGCGNMCDHAAHCELYPSTRTSNNMGESVAERIARLKGEKGGAAAEQSKALAETTKEIEAVAPAAGNPVAELEAKLAAAKADQEAKAKAEAAAKVEPATEKKTRGKGKTKSAGAELLRVATDPITGMSGTITCRQEHADGHVQLFLEPQAADGKTFGRWFNDGRLEIEGE